MSEQDARSAATTERPIGYSRWWCPVSRVWNVPGWTSCSCKRVGGVLGSVPACHPCLKGAMER